MSVNLWSSPEHALDYLRERVSTIPHRGEGEAALLEWIPPDSRRILDLGTGDGRLLAIVRERRPEAAAVGLDFSPTMLDRARSRFGDDGTILVSHNMDNPLPDLGRFDAVVSSFAVHHLEHERKRELFREVYRLLNPGGVFCNLEHVSSPTERLHEEFLRELALTPQTEDPSNKLLGAETQLAWLRECGFIDVDCHWKWRELALLVGRVGQ